MDTSNDLVERIKNIVLRSPSMKVSANKNSDYILGYQEGQADILRIITTIPKETSNKELPTSTIKIPKHPH